MDIINGMSGKQLREWRKNNRRNWSEENSILTLIAVSKSLTGEDKQLLSEAVDFDHTKHIWFHTKHGKEVHFYKNAIHIEWIVKRIIFC